MLNRLSIFNFDTLEELPLPTRVFFFTLAILLGVRFLLYINQDFLSKISPESDLVSILSYLENDYQGEPSALFFGSSRFISAIKSEHFANLVGKNSDSVLNLAINSGSTWEALAIARKNPSLLKSASVAVIEVEPWMFNANRLNEVLQTPARPRPHFYRWATLPERLAIPGFEEKEATTLNFFWPLYERRSLKQWMFGLSSVLEGSHGALAVPGYHYDEAAAQQLANDPHFFPQAAAKSHMNNYQFAKNEAHNLLLLVELLRENAIEVVLVQPPARQEYMKFISKEPAYQEYLMFIRSLENDDVRVIIWENPGEIGLDDSYFIDYGHFNAEGAELFTESVFQKLVEVEGRNIVSQRKVQLFLGGAEK